MQNSYLPPVKFMYLAGQFLAKLAEIDVRDFSVQGIYLVLTEKPQGDIKLPINSNFYPE